MKNFINDFVVGIGLIISEILNSFIASKPNSKFLGKCLRDLKKIKNQSSQSRNIRQNRSIFLTRSFFYYQNSN